jgi:MATE family multidrug resistance protein
VSQKENSQRHVLAIAFPILLSNITTPLIGIVDTAAIGQLDAPYLIGGVAIGGVLFSLLYWAFGFLRMGTTGLTAQAEGAGERKEVVATLIRALILAGVIGVALILLQGPLGTAAFALIEGSDRVERAAQSYYAVRIWGAPAALANYAIIGWFVGRGDARTVLVLTLVLNTINVVLDGLFVLVFDLEVAGVAYGTLIAETTAAALGLVLALRAIRTFHARPSWARIFEPDRFMKTMTINADIMVRTLALVFAFSWFAMKSAEAGDMTLAINAVLINFFHLAAYLLDGFAFAAQALVGQAIGAASWRQFRNAVTVSSLWALVIGAGLSLSYWFIGGYFIDILTVNEAVRAQARTYLIWVMLAPLTGVACFQLDGIFIGATRTADMRNMMILSLAIYLIAWWWLTPLYGNHGLWAALILFFVVRAITLGSRYPALERASFPGKANLAHG